MKKIIQLKLKILAKLILAKYKPEIIGITGSVGKTSTKEAVYAVMSGKYKVRQNRENYNNEFGLPLTILGASSPGRSLFGWVLVFLKAARLLISRDKNYPKILVLEMGVDRPGDMKYLNSIAKCKVGLVTTIGPSHMEFFGSLENIQKEKGELIENLAKGGWAILNYDDEKARELTVKSRVKVLTYGLGHNANIRAQELSFSFENSREIDNLRGISYKLKSKDSFVPVLLPEVIGLNAVYASLAAAAVGIAYGLNLVEISKNLRKFNSPKGRMNLISGIKHTLIIDDTYNSSPQSAMAALDIIKKIPLVKGASKFAILADMLELGSYSEAGHREVGKYLAGSGINKLIVVGERAVDIGKGAEAAGMASDNIFYYSRVEDAGKFVQGRIHEGDLILVKGSQGMRMEKLVKEIMAEPLRAKELLVRQSEDWLNK